MAQAMLDLRKSRQCLLTLPTEILENILLFTDFKTFFTLTHLNSKLLKFLKDDNFCIKYNQVQDLPIKEIKDMSFRRYLSLMAGRGCEMCKQSDRVRKVYWPFNVRCCTECLHANTISEFRLQEQGVDPYTYLGLPYNIGYFYSELYRTQQQVKFYWKKHVQRALLPTTPRPPVKIGFDSDWNYYDQLNEQTKKGRAFMQQVERQERAIEAKKVNLNYKNCMHKMIKDD